MAAINSFLRVVSGAELSKNDRDAALKRAEEENVKPTMTGLAAYVTKCWEAAKTAKEPITDRLLKAQRARMGKYDPALLAEIKAFGGSEEYARITDNKCRIAESWLRDIFLGQTEKPWTIKPTPSPSLPPDTVASVRTIVGNQIAQYFAISGQMPTPADVRALTEKLRDAELQKLNQSARDISERMEKKMEDQIAEGGWHAAFGQFIADLVTYPAAHFKAPVLRKKSSLKWVQEGANWVPQVQDEIMPVFERVDPFKIFPAPGITNPQDGYMIEWLEFTRDDIYNLIGVPGFSEDAIRAVIDQYGTNGLKNWTGLNTLVEQSDINDQQVRVDSPAVFIDCLEFSGPVRGKDLIEWGMEEKDVPDVDKDYEASVWLIGQWVIKAQINPDPLNRRPYYKTSYEEVPGSYWGLGLPDLLEDVQGVANAAVRSLVNNMGMASGPNVGINVDRLPPGEDLTNIHPWKIWQFQDSQVGANTPAIEFFQPNSNVNELLTVVDKFYQFADDFSMVPRYLGGSADIAGGVGRTASGMSMLMNAANKGMKGVVSNIDLAVMTPMLESLYNFNMLFSDDQTIKGDSQVIARGAVSLMQLESLQLRRNEFLQVTANPIDSQIVGPQGRATILREVAKGLEMDVNEIVPPTEVLAQQQAQMMQAQGTPPAPNREMLQTGQATTDNFSPT